ncbi:hypothetical protein HZS_2119 [Henneguya salminicola]|nr:hypothetical protein HZS_2119 [Henneguya salminicola]
MDNSNKNIRNFSYDEEYINNELKKYIVKEDDTLTKIALKFGTTIGELSTLNHLSSRMTYPSQILYIPYNKNRENLPPREHLSGKPRSPLFPGFRKPLQLYKPLKADNDYDLTVFSKCMRIEASLFSFINKHDRKLVELTLNPTSMSIKLHSNTDEHRRCFYNHRYHYCCLNNQYSLPLKSINSFSFYNSINGLINEDLDDQRLGYTIFRLSCHPVSSSNDIAIYTSEKSLKFRSRLYQRNNRLSNTMIDSRSNSYEDLSFINSMYHDTGNCISMPHEQCDLIRHSSISDLTESFNDFKESSSFFNKNKFFKNYIKPIIQKTASNGCSTSDYKNTSNCAFYRFSVPRFKGKFGSKYISKIFTYDKSNKVDRNYYKPLDPKIAHPEINHDNCSASSHVYICVRLKSKISKDSMSIFRDYGHLFDSHDPKLFFEISANHLSVFRDFMDTHLPKNNVSSFNGNPLLFSTSDSESDSEYLSTSNLFIDVIKYSRILDHTLISQLSNYFPTRAMMQQLTLGYSTYVHGTSMRTLYRNMLNFKETPSIIIIIDENKYIFGTIISCLPKISLGFYGNGECVLFRKKPGSNIAEFFPWSHKNTYFIKGDANFLAIGAGPNGYGLWLNEDLLNGHSNTCETFDSEILSSTTDFKCVLIEVWVFK